MWTRRRKTQVPGPMKFDKRQNNIHMFGMAKES
jgi:hypothetical protein